MLAPTPPPKREESTNNNTSAVPGGSAGSARGKRVVEKSEKNNGDNAAPVVLPEIPSATPIEATEATSPPPPPLPTDAEGEEGEVASRLRYGSPNPARANASLLPPLPSSGLQKPAAVAVPSSNNIVAQPSPRLDAGGSAGSATRANKRGGSTSGSEREKAQQQQQQQPPQQQQLPSSASSSWWPGRGGGSGEMKRQAPLPSSNFDDDWLHIDEVERCMNLILSIFVEGDWSIARLRQRVQKAAGDLVNAHDAKLLFVDEIVRNKHVSLETSLPGYVLKTGDPVVIVDRVLSVKHVADCARRLELLAQRGVQYVNYAALPILYPSGKIIAVLQCNGKRDGILTWRDFLMLKMLAQHIGTSAANCRLMESLTEAQRKNRLLNKAATSIASELSMDNVFRKTSVLGAELVACDRCTLYFANEEKTSLMTRLPLASKPLDGGKEGSADGGDAGGSKDGSKVDDGGGENSNNNNNNNADHRGGGVMADKMYALEGMLGYTMRTNESINVRDVASDPRFKAYISRTGGEGIVDCICAPAKNSVGETVGVIQAANLRPGRSFSKGDVERLSMLGTYAVVALENSKALDKASQMSVVSVAIMEKLDLNSTRSKIEEKTQELVYSQSATLFVMDEDANELTGLMLVGRTKVYEKVRIPLGRFAVGQAAVSGQSMILGDHQRDLKQLSAFDERFGTSTRNMLVVPMCNHMGKVIAVIQAANKRLGSFTNLDESLLRIFMNSAGIALSNALKASELDGFLRSLKDLVTRSGAIGSTQDLETCYSMVQENGLAVVPAQALLLHTVDPVTKALRSRPPGAGAAPAGSERPDAGFASGTGIAGYVSETGHIVNLINCEQDSRFHPKIDCAKGIRTESCLTVPVFSSQRDRVMAILQWVNKKGGRRFTNLDENLATVYANIVSVAMHNTSARQDATGEMKDLESQCAKQQELLDIAMSITTLPSADTVAVAVSKHATALLDAARCTVFMVDRDTRELYMLGTDLRPKRFAPAGIVGESIATMKNFVVADVGNHPLFSQAVDQRHGSHTRNMVCVPIPSIGKQYAIGAIQVVNKLTGQFKDGDAAMLSALASLASTALQQVESIQRVQHRNDLLKTVSSDLDLHSVVGLMTETAASLLKAEHCRIFMVDMANSEMWIKNWTNRLDHNIYRIPLNQGIVGNAAVKGRTMNIQNPSLDEHFVARVDLAEGMTTAQSMLVAPMIDKNGRVIAMIQLINRQNRNRFEDEEAEFLQQLGEQGGIVLRNALLFAGAMESKDFHRMLVSTGLRICSERRLENMAEELCVRAKELVQVDSCCLYVKDQTAKDAWLRWNGVAKKADRLPHLGSLANRVVMTGEVNIALDEPDETDGPGANPSTPGSVSFRKHKDFPNDNASTTTSGGEGGTMARRARNILTAPVFAEDRSVIGLVQVSRKQGSRPFSHESEEHVKAICDIASVSLSTTMFIETLLTEVMSSQNDRYNIGTSRIVSHD